MTDPFARLRRFLRELKRRKVYRAAAGYLVVAFVVLQLASLAADAFGFPGWFEPMVWVVAGLGFPIVLVLAWAFEMTPEGMRRTPATSEAEEASEPEAMPAEDRRSQSRLAMKALVGLGLVGAAVAGGWYLMGGGGEPEAEPPAGDRSIAVLPFETLSPGEDSETFARGIHDDLLARLSNISDLKVISRTSVMQYEETDLELPAIAESLGVRWVMEGGVQEMGDQIQVNAQLIDPRTDTHAWADTYRRELTAEDLFALQSDITRRIARSLEAELTSEEEEQVQRRPTEDLDAYKLYVQGRRLLDRRTGASIREAMDLFGQALREDSTYALAWSGLADARGLYSAYGPDSVSRSMSSQERAARRAVELAPDLAEARASLGYVYQRQFNGPAALRELERAVELKPSYAQGHHWLGTVEYFLGRPEAAREHLSLAVELNPRHWNARSWLSRAQLATGDYEQALEETRRERELFPEKDLLFLQIEGIVLGHLKRWDEVRQRARSVEDGDDGPRPLWLRVSLAAADVATGDTAAARERLDRLKEDRSASAPGGALVQALLGDHEAAFQSIERLIPPTDGAGISLGEEGDMIVLTETFRPYLYPDLLSSFRADPRYDELIGKINQYWGLNPDGSLPDSVDVSLDSAADD